MNWRKGGFRTYSDSEDEGAPTNRIRIHSEMYVLSVLGFTIRHKCQSFETMIMMRTAWRGLPYAECQEQTGRTAIEKTVSYRDVESSTNGTSDTNKLNVTRLQTAMSSVFTQGD
jgi:hypothetical protein